MMITFAAGFPVYAAEQDWPREIFVNEGKIVVYQPQLETFKDDKLTARSAISITKTGTSEPIFGAVWFAARVETDRNTRIVTLVDVKVSDSKFPNIDSSKKSKLADILKRAILRWDLTISLDRLLTMLELVEKRKAAAGDLKTTPPRIIFVTHPAVLISIDGDPELRKIDESGLMRVVNTFFYIVFEPGSKNYYLKGSDDWFTARDVMGPWKDEPRPPSSVLAAAKAEFKDRDKGPASEKSAGGMPQIMVTTVPAELIVSEGKPKYTSISGTGLLYMSNTKSDVFMEIGAQKYYVLLSGRWFTSKSLTGKWSHVPSDKLPDGFAKIPPASDKGRVLANVAGTDEAKDAVLDTYIPQTSTVKRDEKVKVAVEYDGKPEFVVIDGTVMTYAVNTPHSIIRIGDKYYLCHESVWYVSGGPSGPWVVSVSVPQVIYTIPPSYPVYNVTYVYVYDYTPKVVYVGYYPGYYGTYIYGSTVVYGTGYVYRGWYGTVYYARPVTWGFSVRYTSYGGWGVRVGYAAPGVWYGRRAVWGIGGVARRAYWRNEYRDRRDYREDRYDDRRDRHDDRRDRQADQRDRKSDRRDVRTQDSKTGTDRKPQNNVFSDRNGNAYRKTDQGWQQRDRNSWSRPDTSTRTSSSRSSFQQNRSSMNRQYKARERGTQRTKDFHRSMSSTGRRRR
jgi:hypothetical protein